MKQSSIKTEREPCCVGDAANNKKISVRQFQAGDVRLIDPQSEIIGLAEFYQNAGPAYTAFDGGKAICAAGLCIFGKTAYGWAVISDAARAKPFFLHRTVVRLLTLELDRYQIEHVIMLAENSIPRANEWLSKMGFLPTHTATRYEMRRDV